MAEMRKATIASVAALAALGLVGGCVVIAGEGFLSSGKRGGSPVFVPPPQAYVMAAIMFAMSALAAYWLLREAKLRGWRAAMAVLGYVGVAVILTRLLAALP